MPRPFDPRAGYFSKSYADYSAPIGASLVQRYIYRHRLEKKNPTAARSEAVQPIVYHLDPGTPEPIRGALLEGARWWNQAFEAAGFIDAFRVELLPADADPQDVRYNTIQWVHRATRGWSYGMPVSDYDGEIRRTVNYAALRQLFALAANPAAAPQVQAVVTQQLADLWERLNAASAPAAAAQRAHVNYGARLIARFLERPKDFAPPPAAAIPPGPPIGAACDW